MEFGGFAALLDGCMLFQSCSLSLLFFLLELLSLEVERDLDLLYLLRGDGDLSYFLRLLISSESSLGLLGPLRLVSVSITINQLLL